MKPIEKIAFAVNASKPGAKDLENSLRTLARQKGLIVTSCEQYPIPHEFLRDTDACCVIGGDGTLLGVVEAAVSEQVPVLGVNLGKLGFLASFTPREAKKEFPRLLRGKYQLAERTMLACRDSQGRQHLALNDVAVKNHSPRLAHLDVYCGEDCVNEYYCDGLIFCTPTGSTAYNLSAGGPLIHPEAQVIAMTPICPHTLSNRSVIFDQHTVLTVSLRQEDPNISVNIDGRTPFPGPGGFPLRISVAELRFSLIQPRNFPHFTLIRNKLQW